jgi:type IV pilus assembly protein PilV
MDATDMKTSITVSCNRSAAVWMHARHQRGFTLIEVLVSLVVLLLGLLGVVSLQAKAHHAQMESYQRSQALVLLKDISDRMNTNRKDAYAKRYAGAAVGGGTTITDCTGKTGHELDLCQWGNLLNGAAEAKGSTSVGAMIGARGCIDYDVGGGTELKDSSGATLAGTGIYTISVVWQGLTPTVAPPATLTCGKNAYGSESLRRVASTTLRLAALGAL